jgi:Cu(I)/Ag(I) efflux system membrane fusion protein
MAVVVAFLAGSLYQRRSVPQTPPTAERTILYWVDPMHPAYKSDKPGIAPDCGMQLEPVYADNGTKPPSGSAQARPGAIQISPEKQQIIGVQIGQVERSSGNRPFRTVGRVALDETRVYRVTTPVDGLVRQAGPIVSGSMVRQDELLATFYNRDFLTAQQTYLYALNTMDRYKDGESEDQLKLTRAQIRAAEENLEFLGMGETQLHEIAQTRQSAREVQLRSPVAGLVLARNVFPGLRFERGTELFRIVELNHVWILADIFENDAEYFRPGTPAQVTFPQQQKVIHAKVGHALPQFDPTTRTLKLRLEVDNPGYLLRPDMFVDVQFSIQMPSAITVPAEAVIDSGLRKTVFVAGENGSFEPRMIETGWRNGDRIQVVRGLAPGERIVVSGTFLLDSESRLQAAAGRTQDSTEKDPACGMDVDVGKARAAGHVREHGGKTYYFCSDQCARDFEKNPDRYLKAAASPRQSAAAPKPDEPAESKSVAAATTVIDKVCGMKIDRAKAGEHVSQYDGRMFYFCSEGCKKNFDADPDQYVRQEGPETKVQTASTK